MWPSAEIIEWDSFKPFTASVCFCNFELDIRHEYLKHKLIKFLNELIRFWIFTNWKLFRSRVPMLLFSSVACGKGVCIIDTLDTNYNKSTVLLIRLHLIHRSWFSFLPFFFRLPPFPILQNTYCFKAARHHFTNDCVEKKKLTKTFLWLLFLTHFTDLYQQNYTNILI